MRALSVRAPLALPSSIPVPALQQTRFGPGILVSLPSGSVAGDLRAVRRNDARRETTYELVVTNESVGPVATYVYALGQTHQTGASWRTMTIPPFTSIAVTIDVPFPPRGVEQRVVAELHADEAHWTIDAHGPRALEPTPRPAKLALLAASLAAVLAGAAYIAFAPKVTALAAPGSTVGGTDFQVAYATSGADRIRWRLENADGVEVHGESVREPRGAFSLQLPRTARAEGYDVRLEASGPLGARSRTVHVVSLPDTAAKPADEPVRIASLFVASPSIASGKPIVINYRTNATGGSVKLLDQSDNVRAAVRLDRSGTTSLPAPTVAVDQPFRIVVDAERNGAHAQSSVGISVTAADGAGPVAYGAVPEDGAAVAADPPAGSAPIALASESYRSGDPIPVSVSRNVTNLRLAIADVAGVELASKNVSAGERIAELTAPVVSSRTKLLVVATFGRGVGQETVVRSIVIRPR
jgi:hypothetical protein